MARMRQIKPEFFLDDELDRLSEIHQKLFIGLWCLADAEGRLVDNPRKVKAQVFPYRDYDVNTLLDELHNAGFIARYQVGEYACIQVLKFNKHQRPHPKELVLGLPNPPENIGSREISRPIITDATGIPSSPAFNGEWRMENGSLENGETKSASSSRNLPRIVEKPTTPEEQWAFSDFEQWFQFKRQEAGLIPEKFHNHRHGSSWWSAAMMTPGMTVLRMKRAVYRFGGSPHWKKQGLPLNAFMSQWDQFASQEAASVHAG